MNLKLSALFALLCIGVGIYAGKCIYDKPREPQIITKTQTKIVKVTKPNGEIIETTESKQDQKPQELKKYGIGIYHDKSAFAEARLGNLPLFLMIQSDFKADHRLGIKYEF